MNRYEVTFTKGNERVNSHTWADTLIAAEDRITVGMANEPLVWEGWTAEVK